MSGPTREQVYGALFALGQGIGAFSFTSRRVLLPDDVPAQPALCQAEYTENVVQVTGMPQRRVWEAAWVIYITVADEQAQLGPVLNPILEQVDALFPATDSPGRRQTLGGLVHKVWIEGRIEKYGANVDAQSVTVIPIKIIVP